MRRPPKTCQHSHVHPGKTRLQVQSFKRKQIQFGTVQHSDPLPRPNKYLHYTRIVILSCFIWGLGHSGHSLSKESQTTNPLPLTVLGDPEGFQGSRLGLLPVEHAPSRSDHCQIPKPPQLTSMRWNPICKADPQPPYKGPPLLPAISFNR